MIKTVREDKELVSVAKNLLEKMKDENFLRENEGKWVVFLKNNKIVADKSLKVLLDKFKDDIIGTMQIPLKNAVMFL